MTVVPSLHTAPLPIPNPGGEVNRVKWVFRPYGDGTGYWVRTIVK